MTSYELQYPWSFAIFRTKHYTTLCIYSHMLLWQLRQEFQSTLMKAASLTSQSEEPGEAREGKDTERQGSSPPRVTWPHSQHRADYVCIFMEEGNMLMMGKDRSAPLITEVFFIPCLLQLCVQSSLPALCCPVPFVILLSGIAENSFGQPHS